ncbi:mucin-17-like [Xyrichtys novacula]|nr:mucin-17-like [Xyrichtys novacula]
MGHRFMFIDGDRAVSGSYSFTWMSARLNKNLITVITGQAADAFDRLFRTLYSNSSSVDLRQMATEPEPEPEPLPQPVQAPPPSAAVARKLFNPKYALLALANPTPSPPAGDKNTQETQDQEDSKGTPEGSNKKNKRRQSKDVLLEALPIHPGLVDLEKVCLIAYLPTWPEPDPPKDVIGFINIRDARKPSQVHLQRSEMFETSQAIRFSSPFIVPNETLPEVAKPRHSPFKPVETNKPQAAQDKAKAGESRLGKPIPIPGPGETKIKEAAKQNSPASGPKCESNKDTTKGPNAEIKQGLNSPTNQTTGQNSTPNINANIPSQSNPWMDRYKSVFVTKNSPKPESNPENETENTQSSQVNSTQTSHTDSSKEKQTVPPNSHTQATPTPSQNNVKINPNIQIPTITKNHVSSFGPESNVNASSSPVPPIISPSQTPNHPLPTSAEVSSLPPNLTPPIPKPRTIQLRITDAVVSDGKKLLECSIAKNSEMSLETVVVQSEPAVTSVVKTSPEKQPEIVPELKKNNETQKNVESTGHVEVIPQQKESGTSQETQNEEAGTNLKVQPNDLNTEKPKVENVDNQDTIPNLTTPKTLTPVSNESTPQTDTVATKPADTKATEENETPSELAQTPNENSTDVARPKTNSGKTPEIQTTSKSESPPNNKCVTDTVDSAISKNNTHNTSLDLTPKLREGKHTPEKSLRLPLSDSHTTDLRSLTPDRESRRLMALAPSPTPDGLSPDLRSRTPDFRTPTPDVSDGYTSAIEDSYLSTTSEEYYECCGSPSLLDPGSDGAANPSQGTTEDQVNLGHTNSPNSNSKKTTSNLTQSVSKPGNVSLSSSILTKEVKKKEEEKATCKDNKKEENEKKEAVKKEGGSQRSGSVKEKVGKVKDALTQVPKKKKAADKGSSAGSNEGTASKRSSTSDPKPKMVSPGKEGSDKEKAPLVPDVVLRKDKAQPNKETEGQKLVQTLAKPPEEQHQESGVSCVPRPSRPLSGQFLGPRPWGSSLLNKGESILNQSSSQVLDNASSSRKLSPLATGVVGSAAARRQADVSRSQQSLLSDGHKTSLLVTHSNSQRQLRLTSQNLFTKPKVEGRGPFSLTFGRLYSLKDLKDKMSRLPAPSRRSNNNNSFLQDHKSTS